MHLGLGSTGWWQGAQGDDTEPLCWFLCFACHRPAAVLTSEPLKLPFCLGWSPHGEGASQGEGTFPLHSSLPRNKSCPDSSFCFHPIWSHGDLSCFFFFFFVFWDPPPAFSRYFVRIIPHVDVFLMYLWDEVSSTSFYSPILIWPPKLLNTLYKLKIKTRVY